MVACLLSLGSNVGNREATLSQALAQIDALPDVRLVRRSKWHTSRPIGGPENQDDFTNAAAVIETKIPPLILLAELKQIEARNGREPGERWAPRTLDIDVLLYGNEVAETEMLTLPHPRMSFRRFVLEPAAEVAPRMLHPVIGWPVERFLLHLDAARDQLAILSPSESLRRDVAEGLVQQFGAQLVDGPDFATANQFWPPITATWLDFTSRATAEPTVPIPPTAPPYAAAAFPKLSILLDTNLPAQGAFKPQWSAIVRRPGRGPTLRLQTSSDTSSLQEITAAIESVWPT